MADSASGGLIRQLPRLPVTLAVGRCLFSAGLLVKLSAPAYKSSIGREMSWNRAFYCCAVLGIIMTLSGCVAPTVDATKTLPSKLPSTETKISQLTLTSTATNTLTPEPTTTETKTPWPTPVFQKACGTVTLGMPGTQSLDKTHPVLVQGTAILCTVYFPEDLGNFENLPALSQARLDLDTGSPGIDNADIAFHEPSTGRVDGDFLFSINGALDRPWSGINTPHAREPTFDECERLSDLFWTDNPPDYVCVITNAGHVARIKVEQRHNVVKDEARNELSLKISFITWDVVVSTPTSYPRP
jgi:hypothetical protein